MLFYRAPACAMRIVCSSPAAQAALPAAAAPKAYVYCGPGAGYRSALSALHSLQEALVEGVQVEQLTPEALLSSGWQEGCLLLVMPGGADLPYCRLLNGRGNRLIREYVEGGGAYLGLCAGAYYACKLVEFEPGTSLEVVGERELAFFPGAARGSIYKGFRYESEHGAAAARLQYLDLAAAGEVELDAPRTEGSRSIAAGDGSNGSTRNGSGSSGSAPPPAAQQQQQWQLQPEWRECWDYINGGPGFYPLLEGPSLMEQPPPGVQVLATYPEREGAAAALLCTVGQGRAVLCGTHPELHPSWLEPCLGAGDAAACSDRTQREVGRSGKAEGECSSAGGLEVLQGAQQRPAGSASNGSSDSSTSTGGSQAGDPGPQLQASPADAGEAEHLQQLHARLVAEQEERWRYWRGLLVAAGLAGWLRRGPATEASQGQAAAVAGQA